MRIPRIFQDCPMAKNQEIVLTASASQHLLAVLRKKIGDELILFNGDNNEYSAQISAVTKKEVVVSVIDVQERNKESPCQIHLGQSISKGERMELVIQKAVELGVHAITPLISEHCVVRLDKMRQEKKQAQWQAIAIAACEQCGRNYVPKINPFINLTEFLSQKHPGLKFVLAPGGVAGWRDYPAAAQVNLLIGPEGGFSSAELNMLASYDYLPLTLGPRILRTETAAFTALSVFQALYGDF